MKYSVFKRENWLTEPAVGHVVLSHLVTSADWFFKNKTAYWLKRRSVQTHLSSFEWINCIIWNFGWNKTVSSGSRSEHRASLIIWVWGSIPVRSGPVLWSPTNIVSFRSNSSLTTETLTQIFLFPSCLTEPSPEPELDLSLSPFKCH